MRSFSRLHAVSTSLRVTARVESFEVTTTFGGLKIIDRTYLRLDFTTHLIEENNSNQNPVFSVSWFVDHNYQNRWGVGGTVACESALRSVGTLLSRVRAPPSASRPDGGP
ncbi:hypothetical protein PoB_005014800 [Plakobranchus ocellatus]|uniref:Uncharacterized protein n=1 Tax=Plakobranchus ocellatus TaxID=259542 RepID=A0AAV4BWQ6_9GAST|nr:hypothetical protein PoB_005014800 [Plakobranchus ocellatus]